MSKTRRWLAFAMAAALFLGTLAPTAALAYRSDRPTDLPDDPPLQYGDPDPGGGAPLLWLDLFAWKQVLIASMRIRFAVPLEPLRAGKVGAADSPLRYQEGTTK